MKKFIRRTKDRTSTAGVMTLQIFGGLSSGDVLEFRFTTAEGTRWRVTGGLPDSPLPDQLSPEQQAAAAAEQKKYNAEQFKDLKGA